MATGGRGGNVRSSGIATQRQSKPSDRLNPKTIDPVSMLMNVVAL